MYHPHSDRVRFLRNKIHFVNYYPEELDIDQDYSDWDEKYIERELAKRRKNFRYDNYPDEDFTPTDWSTKQNYIDKTENPEFMNAFMPEYNEEACKAIHAEKDKQCKDDTNPSNACNKDDDKETLKKKHDHLMLCRNLRMIETFSHCKSKSGNRWIKDRAIDHTSQLNNLMRSAGKCVDYYVDRKREEHMEEQKKNRRYYEPSDPKKYVKNRKPIPRRKSRSKSKNKAKSKSRSFNRRR